MKNMNRRNFIQSTLAATTVISALWPYKSAMAVHQIKRKSNKFLSAYYFRAHMYTMVPHQVREDMKWMADHGTDAVDVAVLEQETIEGAGKIAKGLWVPGIHPRCPKIQREW